MMSACGMLSGLFLSGMSIDRLIAVRFPLAAARLCTTRRAKVTVLISTVPIVIANANAFFAFHYTEDPDTGN